LDDVLALDALVHQRSDEEDRLVDAGDVFLRLQLLNIEEVFFLYTVPDVVEHTFDDKTG
jgi:hypothetical protein